MGRIVMNTVSADLYLLRRAAFVLLPVVELLECLLSARHAPPLSYRIGAIYNSTQACYLHLK